jgi:hypothetical protein
MRDVPRLVIAVLVAAALSPPALGLVDPGPARAAHCGSRGDTYAEALEAKAEARAAAAAAARRAAAREREERYEARWVRRWTRAYGSRVGRWADDAIRAGWPAGELWTLGRIIRAESRGDPRAYNSGSGCAGLLQLAPCHYRGRFDPFDARRNLACGLKLWRGSGWRPWVTY